MLLELFFFLFSISELRQLSIQSENKEVERTQVMKSKRERKTTGRERARGRKREKKQENNR